VYKWPIVPTETSGGTYKFSENGIISCSCRLNCFHGQKKKLEPSCESCTVSQSLCHQ